MSFQDRLDRSGSAVAMNSEPYPPFTTSMPYPLAYTNWYEEQKAWAETAVLFDQSHHMVDLYLTGPDVLRLLSDTAINSFANYEPGRAKQYVPVNEQGYVIGDVILFGLDENEVALVGASAALNWIQFQAQKGGYDVEFTREESRWHHSPAATPGATAGSGGAIPQAKRIFRYEIQGPHAWAIVEKANGGPIDRPAFFRLGEFSVDGVKVRTLNHTMVGVPGHETGGVEFFGPVADENRVIEALLEAGKEFGLVRGGSQSYLSALVESGWMPIPMPAIFGDDLREYREWLPDYTEEGFMPVAGSYRSDRIEDYYVTPWDIGYGHVVKFDHDFIGRAALEKVAQNPRRQKVWLVWDDDSAREVHGSSIVAGPDSPRPFIVPTELSTYDQVLIGDRFVGYAVVHGFTANIGHWASLASVDVADAVDGTEVEILWGEPDGGASNPFIPPHRQTRIRARLSTTSPTAAG